MMDRYEVTKWNVSVYNIVIGGEASLVKNFKVSLKLWIYILCESFTIAQCG
jgi:hypothetical protein